MPPLRARTARYTQEGDRVIMWAIQDIQAGDEILTWSVPPLPRRRTTQHCYVIHNWSAVRRCIVLPTDSDIDEVLGQSSSLSYPSCRFLSWWTSRQKAY